MIAFISNLFGADGFLIFFFALMFFGAKKMPEIARSLGQAMREFSNAKDEFTSELISPPPERALPRAELQTAAPVAAQKPESTETPL